MTKERGIGDRGGVLAVVNGRAKTSSRNNKRRAVENRKRLVRAYVASDIGAGAGTRVGALLDRRKDESRSSSKTPSSLSMAPSSL